MSFKTNGPGFSLNVTSGKNAFVFLFMPLFISFYVKIKLSHQNLLFKYKTVHFYTGIKTPSGLVCFWLLQPSKAPFLQRGVPQPSRPASCWQSCSLLGQWQIFLPSFVLLSWHTPEGESRALTVSSGSPRNHSQRWAGQACLPRASLPKEQFK